MPQNNDSIQVPGRFARANRRELESMKARLEKQGGRDIIVQEKVVMEEVSDSESSETLTADELEGWYREEMKSRNGGVEEKKVSGKARKAHFKGQIRVIPYVPGDGTLDTYQQTISFEQKPRPTKIKDRGNKPNRVADDRGVQQTFDTYKPPRHQPDTHQANNIHRSNASKRRETCIIL